MWLEVLDIKVKLPRQIMSLVVLGDSKRDIMYIINLVFPCIIVLFIYLQISKLFQTDTFGYVSVSCGPMNN